jgi:HEAT repeat protein
MKGKWLTVIICALLLVFGIAAAALMQKRAKIPELIDQMGSADWGDAEDAMRELTSMRSLVLDAVTGVLEEPQRTDAGRWRAAAVLGDIGGKDAIPVLAKALHEFDSKDVQWNCIVALGKLGATEAVTDLRAIFTNTEKDNTVRMTAIRTLGILQADDAVGELITQLEKRPDAKQVEAELREEEREARAAADRAAKRAEYEEAGLPVPDDLLEPVVVEEEEVVEEETDADRPQLRIACCEALALIGDGSETVLDALSQAADNDYEPEYAVRAAATLALADLAEPGNDGVLDVLVRNLRDEQWDINADDEDDDNDGDLRIAAAYAIGKLGSRNEKALTELGAVASDKHYWVQKAAAESIKRLGGRVESD